MDLSGYSLPPIVKGKKLNIQQLLALEICKHFNLKGKECGRWFRESKRHYAFLEEKFRICKERKMPIAYLIALIRNKK